MRERLFEIIRKEFRQAFREPRMRSMLFLPPLIQLLVFGFAVNLDVDTAASPGWISDRTSESRELLAAFQGSGRFDVVATPANDREVQALLDANKVDMVVRVLPGFERDIQRGRSTAGADPDQRHQLQHGFHRFGLRFFDRRQFRRRG